METCQLMVQMSPCLLMMFICTTEERRKGLVSRNVMLNTNCCCLAGCVAMFMWKIIVYVSLESESFKHDCNYRYSILR